MFLQMRLCSGQPEATPYEMLEEHIPRIDVVSGSSADNHGTTGLTAIQHIPPSNRPALGMQWINQVFGHCSTQCCVCSCAGFHQMSALDGHSASGGFQPCDGMDREKGKGFSKISDLQQEAQEQERKHNAQMHSLVMAFTRAALQGVSTTIVTKTGAICPATYQLDKQLRTFSVIVDDTHPEYSHVCLLTGIQEIYCIEDGEEFFPQEVLQKLDESDRQQLLAVRCNDITKGPECESILFLLSDREGFLTCMKTLQLYAHCIESEDTQVSTPQSSLQAQAV